MGFENKIRAFLELGGGAAENKAKRGREIKYM